MLPNLIVIGATTCGTSSLYHYLGRHPEIFMSKEKELRYFLQEVNWGRGKEWYEAQFANGATPVRGEVSPQYTRFPKFPGAPERMASVIPDAKLIYLVRDPIERIVSCYVDNRSTAKDDRCLREAVIEPADNLYLWESSYCMQLEQYLEHFPRRANPCRPVGGPAPSAAPDAPEDIQVPGSGGVVRPPVFRQDQEPVARQAAGGGPAQVDETERQAASPGPSAVGLA
jgi:Sulfotransferase domain